MFTLLNFLNRLKKKGNQHFLLFLQCFQKPSFSMALKFGFCGKKLMHLEKVITQDGIACMQDWSGLKLFVVGQSPLIIGSTIFIWQNRKDSLLTHLPCNSGFNPFPNKPCFLRVCNRSPLKTLWEEEKLLVTSNFSFSLSVFYPFGELSAIFIKFEIVFCLGFDFGRV